MEQIAQLSDPTSNIKIPEAIPAPGEALALLLPLAAPAIAYVIRAAVRSLAIKRKAEIEEQADTREYLQQQNDLLLRELLDRDSNQKPKA